MKEPQSHMTKGRGEKLEPIVHFVAMTIFETMGNWLLEEYFVMLK